MWVCPIYLTSLFLLEMYLVASVSLCIYLNVMWSFCTCIFADQPILYLLAFASSFFLLASHFLLWSSSLTFRVTLTKISPPYLHTRDHTCRFPLNCLISRNYLYNTSWRWGHFPAIYDRLYQWENSSCLTSCKWVCVHIRTPVCTYGW